MNASAGKVSFLVGFLFFNLAGSGLMWGPLHLRAVGPGPGLTSPKAAATAAKKIKPARKAKSLISKPAFSRPAR